MNAFSLLMYFYSENYKGLAFFLEKVDVIEVYLNLIICYAYADESNFVGDEHGRREKNVQGARRDRGWLECCRRLGFIVTSLVQRHAYNLHNLPT